MKRIWTLRQIPREKIQALMADTGFPEVLTRLLINRGLTEPEAIQHYFEARSRRITTPFFLANICVAVDRILKAVEAEESIRIYGDRDVDGITSTVVLLETLQLLTPKVDFTVPIIEDGYGLNPDYIDAARRDGVSLIVTVDCGISNIEEVLYAKSCGIDVIITDHHEAPPELPDCVAVVDPKMNAPDSCRNIAGVGVSFKLAMALEMARGKSLQTPLLFFDLDGPEVQALTFSPRQGFQPLKNLHKHSLAGKIPVFYSQAERRRIAEVIPEIMPGSASNGESEAIFLEQLRLKSLPDFAGADKQTLARELALPESFSGAMRLAVIYLKMLEALEPSVQALWQRSLDLLTIGSVADMVPLCDENRTFIQLGMRFASKTKRQGLKELFTLFGWEGKTLSERDISFNIAPVLNASGRLKSAELAIELLTTDHPERAKALAKELYALNNERKRLGEDCYRIAKTHLLEQNDPLVDPILLVRVPLPNQGVTGIVATRLMMDYCRPVIVLLEDQGWCLGSARSFGHINIINALQACSSHLEKFGGHVGAAGLTIAPHNVEPFRACLSDYARTHITEQDLQPEWLIDAEVTVDQVSEAFLDDLLRFAPFGAENPLPLFMVKNARFQEIRKVGEQKRHLRFKFRRPSGGRPVYGIAFGLGELLPKDSVFSGICHLVFSIEANMYNGQRSAQMVIVDAVFPEFGGDSATEGLVAGEDIPNADT